MTDWALDFLLENITQLMNSDKELLFKVYRKKLTEREQIEWVYVEMQFLQQFLNNSKDIRNDHEEVKEVVAKIRDVTYQVEDIIDSFILINTTLQLYESANGIEYDLDNSLADMGFRRIYEDCVDQAEKINNVSEPLMEHIDCIKTSNTEMMGSLSWLRLQIHRGKFHHHHHGSESDDGVIAQAIKSFIKQVTKKRKSFGSLIESSEFLALLPGLSDWVLYWAEKNPEELPWYNYNFFSSFNNMVNLAKTSHHAIGEVIELLKPMTKQVMEIYEMGLSIGWLQSHMADVADQIYLFFNSFQQTINKVEKIHHEFAFAIEEIKAVSIDAIMAVKWGKSMFGYVKMHGGLGRVTEDIKSIKREVMEIYEKKMYGIEGELLQIKSSSHVISSKPANPVVVEEETVVGLEDDIRRIMELLTEQHQKELKLIPIIGMPGLGKTTLAQKVYTDPLIAYHFYIRAWIYVSQVYEKRDLLLSILNSAHIQLNCQIEKMRDEELGDRLYKSLKGKRYLVVMDDLWEIKVWDDLKRYFPNDRNGSRIMFTSRLVDVALHANPYNLRFLDEDESWDLMREKTFRKESCPPELTEIGKQIAKKCQGLPLAIVVISGLLAKNDKTQKWWKHVAKRVSSYMASDPEQYLETLSLSFNHLPRHLKPCFLYFSAFPEDYDIPVRQLIWLWVSEGFIQHDESKSLEDVAEDYLMDLIDRSLIVVSNKRSNGGIKACHIHDLLRDLCLRKAREENFLQQISWYEQSSLNLIPNKQRRLCIHSRLVDYNSIKYDVPHLRSFLSFYNYWFVGISKKDMSLICGAFKLLRVLNLSSIEIPFFHPELQMLVHLRYLAIYRVTHDDIMPLISNLWKLETFVVGGSGGPIYLGHDILKKVKLRHLCAERFLEFPSVVNDVDAHLILHNLQTISKLDLQGGRTEILARMPNLRKLKCECDPFPNLDFLIHLETLNAAYKKNKTDLVRLPHPSWFPPNLKCLTLSFFRLPWKEIWILGSLPNLEVLKLSCDAFEGSSWNTNENEFPKLKFLKLEDLEIEQWNTLNNHFPNLRRLVLNRCRRLEEIPHDLGDICTLETIQLWYCSSSAETSAREIQAEQQSKGNDGLKIFIHTRRHA